MIKLQPTGTIGECLEAENADLLMRSMEEGEILVEEGEILVEAEEILEGEGEILVALEEILVEVEMLVALEVADLQLLQQQLQLPHLRRVSICQLQPVHFFKYGYPVSLYSILFLNCAENKN